MSTSRSSAGPPAGGGHRAHGRGERPGSLRGLGYEYIHAAVDDHSRLAYAEILLDEKGTTCVGFLTRAAAFFHAHGITRIERVMTDNAKNWPSALVAHARKVAAEHHARTGAPIDTPTLRTRFGVPAPMAEAIAAQL